LPKKLIIVSASSSRKRESKEPIPAIERYNGIYFRTLRKYLREGKLRNTDILINSKKFGLIRSNKKIPYYEPSPGNWGSLGLNKETVDRIRKKNLHKLKKLVNAYSEIYVNVGREYMKLIEGFENFTSCKIIYATGRGLGPKALHMKEWINKID